MSRSFWMLPLHLLRPGPPGAATRHHGKGVVLKADIGLGGRRRGGPTRRSLLALAVLGAAAGRGAAAAGPGIVPVAIRWDAWYSQQGSARAAQNALDPAEWHFRAPWFAVPRGPDGIAATGTQADMDLEIQLAAAAGIKAWAFDMYQPMADGSSAGDPGMSAGFALYQASAYRAEVAWCGIAGAGVWGTAAGFATHPDRWRRNVAQWVDYFRQPHYLRVGGRPVFFILWNETEVEGWFSHAIANVGTAIAELRRQCAAAGLGDPYLVMMAGRPAHSAAVRAQVGADAIGNYIPDLTYATKPGTWDNLQADAENFWAAEAATGNQMVPIVQTGWDQRPRYARPEPWVHPPADRADRYFAAGTPAQVAGQIADAVAFIRANAGLCGSKLLLIYSWNEFDEGGNCLCPTLGDQPVNAPPDGINGPQTSRMLRVVGPMLIETTQQVKVK